jgi:hypothetical protein
MSKSQITVRLPPQKKIEFDSYAAGLGLESADLLKLLIARERKLERLMTLKRRARIPRFDRQTWGMRTKKPTITARFSDPSEVDAFDDYAERCGLIRQSAGAWLLVTELEERWLEKALSMRA